MSRASGIVLVLLGGWLVSAALAGDLVRRVLSALGAGPSGAAAPSSSAAAGPGRSFGGGSQFGGR